MILKEIKQKPLEYIFLALIFILGFFLYIFIPDASAKRWAVYLVGTVYFSWSLYHHYKRGDLELSIVVEYLLIILIGIVFLSGTLF
jgi:ABC-type multidrug transport system permease subunit